MIPLRGRWATDFLGIASSILADVFKNVGGLAFASPLKIVTEPTVQTAVQLLGDRPWLLLLLSLSMMFASLRYLVKTLKGLVLTRVASLFDRTIFRTPARALIVGLAEKASQIAMMGKWIPVCWILFFFYIVPFLAILALR